MRFSAFLLIAAAASLTSQTRSTPALGAVSGVVTDSSTHRAIQGADVQLGPPPRPPDARLGNTFTDERGRFVFTGVGAGTYFVNAFKPGFTDGHYGPGVNGALGGSVIIGAGEWFADANVEMTKLGAIGGRIADERGQPTVGAYVRVLAEVMIGGAPHVVAGPASTTNDRGEYRIWNLTAGRYIVVVPSVAQSVPSSMSAADLEDLAANRVAARAQAPVTSAIVEGSTALIVGNYPTPPTSAQGVAHVYPATFYPGVTSFAAATAVDLRSGDEKSGVDFALQTTPAFRVSGRVENPTGQPAGIVLRLMPRGLEELGVGSESATAAVGTDGRFAFLGVPAGTYTLLAPGSSFEFNLRPQGGLGGREPTLPSTPGLARGGLTGGLVSGTPLLGFNTRVPPDAAAHAGFARMAVTVGLADLTNLVVPLEATATLHVQLADDTGAAVQIGTIQLEAANASPALGSRLGVSVDKERRLFVFPEVPPGDYVVRVPNSTIQSVTIGGEDYLRRPLSVASGADVTLAVVLASKPAKLSGVVRDARNVPVPLAGAIAFPVDQTLWTNYGFVPTWIRPSVGTSNGSYQIANIRAADYYVVGVDAAHINAWANPEFLQSAIPFATKITLDWGDAKVLDVRLMITNGRGHDDR